MISKTSLLYIYKMFLKQGMTFYINDSGYKWMRFKDNTRACSPGNYWGPVGTFLDKYGICGDKQ